MAQPPPREGRLGHHSRDSCSNCHEDHQKTETDKQEECFWVHIVAFDPEGALGHVNQEPKWTNARKRHRLEPRIDYKNKQRDWERVWRSLVVTQLEDFERSRHQLAGYWGQKEILQYVTKTAWMWVWRSSSAGRECEVSGADQAGAGGLHLTTHIPTHRYSTLTKPEWNLKFLKSEPENSSLEFWSKFSWKRFVFGFSYWISVVEPWINVDKIVKKNVSLLSYNLNDKAELSD